ncbi:MAG TPA: protein kinase [Victivallales bacterium]|nr:protein kinase [Victivallales bacterium]HPO89890.1 protein kinase [Victivallales bacterium]HRR05687.1 protein kinase [Victivallales bacterium]HRR28084.1 protein kinase [Victivallales bacterium]HRU01193.1 protein kinase [Victivallales bacterium]
MARIIISDDDRVSLLVLKNIVDFLGHEAVPCSNGQEAIEEFQKLPADLILLDVNMPIMNGIEACKKIRQLPGGGTVPIIMISGLDDEEDVIHGLNAGANDYLLKPVKDSHLLAKMKIFLRMSSLHNSDFELAKNHVVFADKYKIKKLLGYGSHSIVFLADDISCENRKIALKLFKETSNIAEIFNSFAQTAQNLKEIDCNYILKTYDYGKCDNRLFVAMEYAEQGDISKILRSRTFYQSESLKLGIHISNAIAKIAEKSIVHFDIKPQNIMLNTKKDFLLADFGVASPKASMTISINKEIWGSPAYMPPEYLSGDEIYPELSDIYSLGITLYESISGANPFYSERAVNSMISQLNLTPPSLSEVDSRIHPLLSDIIDKMLSKNPEKRPRAKEIINEFSKLLVEIEKNTVADICLFIHKKAFSNEEQHIEEETETYVKNDEPIKFKIPKQKVTIENKVENKKLKISPEKNINTKAGNLKAILSSVGFFEVLSLPSFDIAKIIKIVKVVVLFSIFGFAIFAGVKIYSKISTAKDEIKTYEPLVIFKCEKCGLTIEKRTNLDSETCPKCSAKMWPAYECKDCGYIFPMKLNDYNSKDNLTSPYSCPKCKSENTSPAITSEEYLNSKGISR